MSNKDEHAHPVYATKEEVARVAQTLDALLSNLTKNPTVQFMSVGSLLEMIIQDIIEISPDSAIEHNRSQLVDLMEPLTATVLTYQKGDRKKRIEELQRKLAQASQTGESGDQSLSAEGELVSDNNPIKTKHIPFVSPAGKDVN